MIGRFVNYNCLVSYLGGLDKESFGMALVETLGKGPKYITRIQENVSLIEWQGTQLLKIELLYHIEKGILSDEEKLKYVKQLRADIKDAITSELKDQKVIFNIEDES